MNTRKKQTQIAENDFSGNFKSFLQAYKKFKQIAKLESEVGPVQKIPANISKDDMDKIKHLELRLGYKLIPVEDNLNEGRKEEILNGINVLLDDYMRLFTNESKPKNVIPILPSKIKSANNDFNGFFE